MFKLIEMQIWLDDDKKAGMRHYCSYIILVSLTPLSDMTLCQAKNGKVH